MLKTIKSPLFNVLLTVVGTISIILGLNLLLNPIQLQLQQLTGLVCMLNGSILFYLKFKQLEKENECHSSSNPTKR